MVSDGAENLVVGYKRIFATESRNGGVCVGKIYVW